MRYPRKIFWMKTDKSVEYCPHLQSIDLITNKKRINMTHLEELQQLTEQEVQALIKKEEENIKSAKDCLFNLKQSLYDSEQYLILYNIRLIKIKNQYERD